MKFSLVLSSLLVLLPATQGSVLPRQGNNRGGFNSGNNGGNNNNAGNNAGNNNNGNGGNTGGNNTGNPQTSLTLDPRVIGAAFASDGQAVPEAGRVPSLTSTNNFINYCLTVPQLPITDGKQIQTGSCNPIPIGSIPAKERMPSSKFTNPNNGDTIASGTTFTISMAVKNLKTGNFVNPDTNYFAAPQQLDGQGIIIGHSHVVIEALNSLSQTTPGDPTQFIFFKGLNTAAANGVLSTDVANGVPPGFYRMCSINTAANHQPAIAPVAQHGSLDDCVYFTATAGGVQNNNGNNNTGNNGGNNNAGANPGAGANNGSNGGANGGNGFGRNRGGR